MRQERDEEEEDSVSETTAETQRNAPASEWSLTQNPNPTEEPHPVPAEPRGLRQEQSITHTTQAGPVTEKRLI